jgi:hypothetical protein
LIFLYSGGELHTRVGIQYLLDLARPDLEARRVDHVFVAVDNREVALGIHDCHITRVQPALVQCPGRLFQPLQVCEEVRRGG